MIGFKDLTPAKDGKVVLDGVIMQFGPDATLWNPTALETGVLTANALRRARFQRQEPPGNGHSPDEPQPPSVPQAPVATAPAEHDHE